MSIELNGRHIETDQLGFLLDPGAWDRGLAELLAARQGIELGPDHWCLIEFVREWYQARQTLPEMRRLLKAMQERLGAEKATRKYLHTLFPYGYGVQLCRIAGMTMPRKVMLDD